MNIMALNIGMKKIMVFFIFPTYFIMDNMYSFLVFYW